MSDISLNKQPSVFKQLSDPPSKNLQTIERFELLGVPSSNILIISFIVGICAELITQTFKLSIKTRSTVGNAKASLADLHASATDQYLCQICILKLQNSKTDLQKMPFASLCLSPSFFWRASLMMSY